MLFRNMFFQAVAQVGGNGLLFLVYILLARMLGPALYGTFDYTLSIVQITGKVFFDLGLILIVTHEISTANDRVYIPSFWLKIIGGLAGTALLIVIGYALKIPMPLLLLLTGFAVLMSFYNLNVCVFRAKGKMESEAVSIISQRIILIVLLVFLYFKIIDIPESYKLEFCGSAFFFYALCGLALAGFYVRKYLSNTSIFQNISTIGNGVKELAKKSFPLIGVGIFGYVYNKIDIFLLGTLSTKDQVGYYNAAYRIMEASFLIPLVITNTVFPRLSMTWIKDKISFKREFLKYVSILVISGIAVAALLALLSSLIIPILYGDKFLPSVKLLFMLAFAVFFIYPGYLVTQSLVILGKSTYYFALTVFATCLNILINLYLIPRYGASGASLATIITEAAVTLTGSIIIFKTIRNKNK